MKSSFGICCVQRVRSIPTKAVFKRTPLRLQPVLRRSEMSGLGLPVQSWLGPLINRHGLCSDTLFFFWPEKISYVHCTEPRIMHWYGHIFFLVCSLLPCHTLCTEGTATFLRLKPFLGKIKKKEEDFSCGPSLWLFHKHRMYFRKIKERKEDSLERKLWFSQIAFPRASSTLACLQLVRQGHDNESPSFHNFDTQYSKSDITVSSS